jgi:hypothetical protein
MYSGCKPKVQHLFSQTAKVHLLHMYHGPTTAGIKGLADKEMIFCAKSICCYSTPSKLGFLFFFFFFVEKYFQLFLVGSCSAKYAVEIFVTLVSEQYSHYPYFNNKILLF